MKCVCFLATAEPMEKDPKGKARLRWRKAIMKLKEKGEEYELTSLSSSSKTATRKTRRQKDTPSLYLNHGKAHTVWKPNQHSGKWRSTFSDVVNEAIKHKQELIERQKSLQCWVKATQDVLKIQKGELARVYESSEEGEEEEQGKEEEEEEEEEGGKGAKQGGVHTLAGKERWQHAIKTVVGEKSESKNKDMKKLSLHFHDIVNQYFAAMPQSTFQSGSLPMDHDEAPSLESASMQDGVIPFQKWKRRFIERQWSKEEREKNTKGSLHETTTVIPDTIAEEAEVTSAAEPN